MTEGISKPLEREASQRCIGRIHGRKEGPTLVFFAGIHGNEMAGVKAMERLFTELRPPLFNINGTLIGIRGNLPAILHGKRYMEQDLNRLWTEDNMTMIKGKSAGERNVEENELIAIDELLEKILNTQTAPFYFIDFHTTSSKTVPFITINDAMMNRKFSNLYPVPIILGLEEYLEGPLLSWMNEKGYVSLGFESGQHTDFEAVENATAFMWLSMVFTGVLPKNEVHEYESYHQRLQYSLEGDKEFYEVIYRQVLAKHDMFEMAQGYINFQKVFKGDRVGILNQELVKVEKNALMFMPLYQQQGEEAFFLIRSIPKWALLLSAVLRKAKIDALLSLLPGISWRDKNKDNLLLDLSIARFFARSFFHLLGYRARTLNKSHVLLHNRERSAKNVMYRNEPWY